MSGKRIIPAGQYFEQTHLIEYYFNKVVRLMIQDLSDTSKVIETSSTDEVNRLLSEGWILTDTYKTAEYSTEASDEKLMYSLRYQKPGIKR